VTNKLAEGDLAVQLLESTGDRRLSIDDLVAQVIKANGRRAIMANKKRVLEVIYGLQQSGVLKLENGVAILNNLMLSS
jgi:hypothetical protein